LIIASALAKREAWTLTVNFTPERDSPKADSSTQLPRDFGSLPVWVQPVGTVAFIR